MKEYWNIIVQYLTKGGIKLIWGLVILVVGLVLIHFLNKILKKRMKFRKIDPGVAGYLYSFFKIVLYAVLFLTVASLWGVPLTSLVALLTTASVAISLAMQGALSNFIGGIMLLVLRPFKVGDYIKVGDDDGTVTSISIFYTKLDTPDNKQIVLPNSSLTNASLVNYTAQDTRRIDLTYSVSYSSDIDKVKNVLLSVAKDCPYTILDPEPVIGLFKQNESSLDFALKVWCKTGDYWTAYFDLNERAKKYLDGAGIEIPFPQMDVHVKGSEK